MLAVVVASSFFPDDDIMFLIILDILLPEIFTKLLTAFGARVESGLSARAES
jgi:hypothetical protein